jgi:hypothetical protein
MQDTFKTYKFLTHPSLIIFLKVQRTRCVVRRSRTVVRKKPFARPPHALFVIIKDGAHAAAAPSHLFHESRWTRVTSLVAMPSVVVTFCVRCRVAESADAQPRALPAAAAVRVPILITGAVAVGSPLFRNATPSFVGTARMVSFPDQLAYRRQTPSAPESARRSGNATRRVVPTNKGRRTTIAGVFGARRANPG